MDDLDESELPSSQASGRVIQQSDICIKVTEEELKYRRKLFPDTKSVLKSSVRCTACGTSLLKQLSKGQALFFHPILQVLVCEDCRVFYDDGIFPVDEDKSDTYCRWCAQGGSLYCCSACNFVFCKPCIRRNFKKSMLEEIEEEDWKCFVCNPESLWKHRAICWASRNYVKENPGDHDDADDVDTSNDERKREKRRVAREKKWGRRGDVAVNSERPKRSKHPTHSLNRKEINSDDDSDQCSTSKVRNREKVGKPKEKKVKKYDRISNQSKRKEKDDSDETNSSADDDDGKRRKSKKLKEKDEGSKHERGKDKKQNIPTSPKKNASADESGTVAEGVSFMSTEEKTVDEDAQQILVMRRTSVAMERLIKETFTITASTSKKVQQLHAWVSKKNQVSDNQLPTTPIKFTKMIEAVNKILQKLSEHTEELKGKVSEAGKDWMSIVNGDEEGETEMIVDRGNDRKEEVTVDNREEGGFSLIIANETELINDDIGGPEDVSPENEAAKTIAEKTGNESGDSVTENMKSMDHMSVNEEDGTEIEIGEKGAGNDSVIDPERSSELEDAAGVETNGRINDEDIEKESEKDSVGEKVSIGEEKGKEGSTKKKSSVHKTVKKSCSGENIKNKSEAEGKATEDKEKGVTCTEGEKSDVEGDVEVGRTLSVVGESEESGKLGSEAVVEKSNPLHLDSSSEADGIKKNEMSKKVDEEDKSGECLENSTQDLFALDEDINITMNEVLDKLDNELSHIEKTVEVGKDTVSGDEHTERTRGEVPKGESENSKDDDGETLERTESKVKPSSEDRNAKLAFLLDSSVSSYGDDECGQASEDEKLGSNKLKSSSSDSESGSELQNGDSSRKKVEKKSKKKIPISKFLSKYEDEKLKSGCFVQLERLKNHEHNQVNPNSKRKRDSMIQAINRLGDLSSLDKARISKKKSDVSDTDSSSDEECVKKIKRRVKRKVALKESDESNKDSSDDEIKSTSIGLEKIPEPSKDDAKSGDKMLNALAAELLANSSNFESSSSDSEHEPTKKKVGDESKGKAKKKEKNGEEKKNKKDSSDDSSSADNKPVSSKSSWRNDRLLRAKLSETDSDEAEKKWRAKKEREKASSDFEKDFDTKACKTRKKSAKVLSDSDSDVLKVLSSAKSSDSSDFEVKKKSKRKRRESSDTSSNKSWESKVRKKKKLNRIKMIDSDSDVEIMSEDDRKKKGKEEKEESEKENTGKGRKKIRKVMKDNGLAEETRAAAKEEEERLKRIAEKQKLYNEIFTDKQNLDILDKLVLDFDPDTKEPLVSVHPSLVKKMKPHQAEGVKFIWEACFESLKRIEESQGSGCILAHCMGLGKTLQVIALVHTLLTNPKTKVNTVLVICPLNTVLNWVNEFNVWLKDVGSGEDVEVYEISRYKANVERMYQLKDWRKDGGVMILGYEMYRNLSNMAHKKIGHKSKQEFQLSLVDPGPDLVICDEGHLLKNIQSALSKAVNSIKTSRRIVLTGTPLQNNLKEYHCMIQFVKPNLLGTQKEFLNRFVNPITNGQLAESTPHDVRVMKRRAHVLHKLLEGCVQRRDYLVLTPFLPPKYEYVILIQLTELQSKLYIYYLNNLAKMKGGTTLFNDFQNLQRIWTHPRLLKLKADHEEKKKLMESDSEGSLKDFICDDETSASSYSSSDSDKKKKKNGKKKALSSGSSSESDIVCINDENIEEKSKDSKDENEKDVEEEPSVSKEWWKSFVTPEDYEILEHSGKLVLLFDILQKCELIGDKVLVFSQSLISLDIIEHFLENIDDHTQKIGTQTQGNSENSENTQKFLGSWSKGLDYFRIDGSVSAENRSLWCKHFNRESNLRARLFLISTRAGGMGINLIGANRVILFDASWNPSNDLQSIFRIYRFGQTKPCYVYRFLAQGTMEEKIYNRQVTKLSLALRVVDEQQIERHFNLDDLQELYRYDPKVKTKRPTPLLPKDRLLAELIQKYPHLIDNYHEHDSLLENKTEEELTEDERKAAWEDFENDKKGVLPEANLPEGFVNNFGGVLNHLMPGSDLFGDNAIALRQAIMAMHPTATEEQIETEVNAAASRISQYFTNTPYIQMQQFYNAQVQQAQQVHNAPHMNMYQQQMAMMQPQYDLQNYYHHPVIPSSLTNRQPVLIPVRASTSQNMRHPVRNNPLLPVTLPSVNLSQNLQMGAKPAPKLKVRSDLMPSTGNNVVGDDITLE